MKATPSRTAAALVCAGLLLTSCGVSLTRKGTPPERTPPSATTEVGAGVELPVESAVPEDVGTEEGEPAPDGEAAFILTVIDQNGAGAALIPVEVSGPAPQTVVTETGGTARVTGPPGHYSFQVRVGCTDRVFVTFGSSGRGGIVASQITRGQLRADWQHRYGPTPNAYASVGPNWVVGQPVDVRYEVGDRCREGDRAPGATLPTYRFRTSPNLKVVGEPRMQADGQGFATVRVSCTAPGGLELVVFDSRNPPDAVDLPDSDRSFGSRPTCVE